MGNRTIVRELKHEHDGMVYKVKMVRREHPDAREGICRGRIVRLRVDNLTTGISVGSWDGVQWTRRPGSPESRAAVLDILEKYN